MGKGIDRTEILRRDCPTCKGKGYVSQSGGESSCEPCGGAGLLEKEVPFKFDGSRSLEEVAELWGVDDPSEIEDKGHDGQGKSRQDPRSAEGEVGTITADE